MIGDSGWISTRWCKSHQSMLVNDNQKPFKWKLMEDLHLAVPDMRGYLVVKDIVACGISSCNSMDNFIMMKYTTLRAVCL